MDLQNTRNSKHLAGDLFAFLVWTDLLFGLTSTQKNVWPSLQLGRCTQLNRISHFHILHTFRCKRIIKRGLENIHPYKLWRLIAESTLGLRSLDLKYSSQAGLVILTVNQAPAQYQQFAFFFFQAARGRERKAWSGVGVGGVCSLCSSTFPN